MLNPLTDFEVPKFPELGHKKQTMLYNEELDTISTGKNFLIWVLCRYHFFLFRNCDTILKIDDFSFGGIWNFLNFLNIFNLHANKELKTTA